MLDEQEFARVAEIYAEATRAVALYRRRHDLTKETVPTELLLQPVRHEYQDITGVFEPDPTVIMHHRVALYGPECSNCGKPLMSPEARSCGVCGHRREP